MIQSLRVIHGVGFAAVTPQYARDLEYLRSQGMRILSVSKAFRDRELYYEVCFSQGGPTSVEEVRRNLELMKQGQMDLF